MHAVSPSRSAAAVDVARFRGVLIGTAVGDAVGLPAEGLRPATIQRRWQGVWRHRLLFGRGMVSDDTEHAVMVAQSLVDHPTDEVAFRRALARRLRWWLAGLPAGIGLATGRAIFKLWLGWPPHRSGIASAGNGPMMRSAIIGVRFAEDEARRRAFVASSTRITHVDPRAETAALAVAELVAGLCSAPGPGSFGPIPVLRAISADGGWQALVTRMERAREAGASVADFARELGLERGITGYAWHTAPMAIYAWWRHRGDFRAALEAALNCGGDTDTVGAIVGALAGAEMGEKGIPSEWIAGIKEWPRTIDWIRRVADALAKQANDGAVIAPPRFFWPGVPLRNALFLAVVLTHGFARLFLR